MERILKSFLTAIISFILIDFIWIGWISKAKYTEVITEIQGVDLEVRYGSALMVYILMALAIIVWVLPKIKEDPDHSDMNILKNSFKWGGMIGLLVYGIYNFTNNSIFRHWDIEVVVIDTLWGGFLFSIVSYLTYAISY